VTNPNKEYKDRGIITDEETDLLLNTPDLIQNEYFKLRSKAIVATAKVFGKRESEIARLEMRRINKTASTLELTFILSKKRKKGLFQFIKFCREHDPEKLKLPLPEIEKLWKLWQDTQDGHRIRDSESLKSVDLNDRYGKHLVAYYDYVKAQYPNSLYLFPRGKTVFGKSYIVYEGEHLHPKGLLRLLKELKADTWMHLYRETKGAQVAREKGRNLAADYEVKDTLALANESTAYNYVKRFVAKKEHS
jgi:hypothetical protein